MDEFLKTVLIVCPLVFLAGFVDSVAGGGGLISLPAYLMAGIPAHFAAGTNKVVNGTGNVISFLKYLRSGKIRLCPTLTAAAFALLGSSFGTKLATLIPEATLKTVMLVALPCAAVFLALKKDLGGEERAESDLPLPRELFRAALIGLLIGCYDGLIGPGTGTFMLMGFAGLLSMDLLSAAGSARLCNLASCAASAAVWILNGSVAWRLVLPAALCSVLGNYLGARFAIRGGGKKIRGMIFVVLGLLFLKMLYDLVG